MQHLRTIRCARCGRARQRGFTLIELVVTFAVIAIMLTLAAPSFVTFQQNAQLTSAANDFVAALSAARAEAMKRQLNVYVRPASGDDWTRGWIVYADSNWDTNYTAGTDVLISQPGAMATGVTVQTNVATSDATSHYVMFSGSGFVSNDTTGAVIGSQALGLQNSNGSRLVIINGSGRLRVCTPPVGAAGDQSCVSGTF